MMVPVASTMHRQGVQLLLYLDDLLLLAPSQEDARIAVQSLLQLCTHLNIKINNEKSHPELTQSIV